MVILWSVLKSSMSVPKNAGKSVNGLDFFAKTFSFQFFLPARVINKKPSANHETCTLVKLRWISTIPFLLSYPRKNIR